MTNIMQTFVDWLKACWPGHSFYEADYEAAMQEDLAYAKEHPDCSFEEAHQHRDEVMKKYHQY